MKKIFNFKIIGMFFFIIILLLVLFTIISIIKNKIHEQEPWYSDNYYEKTNLVGELEKEYAKLGEYEVSSYELKSNDKFMYKVWYPTELENSTEKYPLVVVVNASNIAYINYEPYFSKLTSYGFIVIGNTDRNSATGESGINSLKFILKENENNDSVLYNKVDLDRIGVEGTSQGGVGAINVATAFKESKYFKSLFTQSVTNLTICADKGWNYDLSKIDMPYLMLSSTGKSDNIIMNKEQIKENFDNIKNEYFTAKGRIVGIDHENMLEEPDSYRIAWFLWTLKDNEEASKVFIGEKPELLNNEKYIDVETKNILIK